MNRKLITRFFPILILTFSFTVQAEYVDKGNGGEGNKIMSYAHKEYYNNLDQEVLRKLYLASFCKASDSAIQKIQSLKNFESYIDLDFKIDITNEQIQVSNIIMAIICSDEYDRFKIKKHLIIKSPKGKHLANRTPYRNQPRGRQFVSLKNFEDGTVFLSPANWDSYNKPVQEALAIHEMLAHETLKLEKTNNYVVSSCLIKNQKALDIWDNLINIKGITKLQKDDLLLKKLKLQTFEYIAFFREILQLSNRKLKGLLKLGDYFIQDEFNYRGASKHIRSYHFLKNLNPEGQAYQWLNNIISQSIQPNDFSRLNFLIQSARIYDSVDLNISNEDLSTLEESIETVGIAELVLKVNQLFPGLLKHDKLNNESDFIVKFQNRLESSDTSLKSCLTQ